MLADECPLAVTQAQCIPWYVWEPSPSGYLKQASLCLRLAGWSHARRRTFIRPVVNMDKDVRN